MMTPLGYFSHGFRIPGSKCQLTAASCTLRTAWKNCNNLYEKSLPGQKEMIRQLATLLACGDNWQVKIGKDFQDGKSGIMQRGTAFLMKKNKYIPVGTVMSSPSGLRFTVLETDRINAYIIVVTGTLLPNQHQTVHTSRENEENKEETAEKQESEQHDTERGFNWPNIGWDVVLIKGFDPCRALTYVDQYVPAPYYAQVETGFV